MQPFEPGEPRTHEWRDRIKEEFLRKRSYGDPSTPLRDLIVGLVWVVISAVGVFAVAAAVLLAVLFGHLLGIY